MQASFEKDSILVLDVDGTLTDSVRIHQRALLGAMESLAFDDLNTDWGSYPHHTDTGILIHAHAEHGRALPQPHDLARFEHEIDERFTALLNAHGLAEIPGARAFVEAAHRSRWGVVFATGGIRQVSHRKLRSVAIDYTDAMLITASEYSSREQLVAGAIKRAQAGYGITNPRAIVSIGDGVWDLKVARQLGIDFVGIGSKRARSPLYAEGVTVYDDMWDAMHWLTPGRGRASGTRLASRP
jgi:phosphoglycolate phosphatase-like HAD superfamily hydrolase